jgi:malonyl-CoA O-methyltransferase
VVGPGDAVAAAYDRWSAQYDADVNRTRDLDGAVLRAGQVAPGGLDVLELGCGTGKNTRWLATARSLHALDFSDGMLAQARAAVPDPHVRFTRHDLRLPWPVADRSVDLIVGNLVLEHIERLDPVFAEVARVLRPGGTLYLCELHPFRQARGGPGSLHRRRRQHGSCARAHAHGGGLRERRPRLGAHAGASR